MATAPPSSRALAPLLFALLIGCDGPPCKQVCEKLLECEEVDSPRIALSECEDSCEAQEALYQQWTDEELEERFVAYKECVDEEECSAIAEGACYDERLFAW
jgi:hypothetical protein